MIINHSLRNRHLLIWSCSFTQKAVMLSSYSKINVAVHSILQHIGVWRYIRVKNRKCRSHGRPLGGGGQGEGKSSPWNLKKNDVICCRPKNTLKFSLTTAALAIDTLYFSLKRRKKRTNCRLRL